MESLVFSVLDFGWLHPWVLKPGWIHHHYTWCCSRVMDPRSQLWPGWDPNHAYRADMLSIRLWLTFSANKGTKRKTIRKKSLLWNVMSTNFSSFLKPNVVGHFYLPVGPVQESFFSPNVTLTRPGGLANASSNTGSSVILLISVRMVCGWAALIICVNI